MWRRWESWHRWLKYLKNQHCWCPHSLQMNCFYFPIFGSNRLYWPKRTKGWTSWSSQVLSDLSCFVILHNSTTLPKAEHFHPFREVLDPPLSQEQLWLLLWGYLWLLLTCELWMWFPERRCLSGWWAVKLSLPPRRCQSQRALYPEPAVRR